MDIRTLAREIGLDSCAADEVIRQFDDPECTADDRKLTGLFREDEQAFFSMLRRRPDWKQDALRIYLMLACEAYPMYRERGISDRIYFDTMHDIAIWERECMRKYGVHGLEEVEWIARHLRLDLFCLGSLQFEPILLQEESLALNVHIQAGADLSREACMDSFRQALEFFGSGFDMCSYVTHGCLHLSSGSCFLR